MFILACGSRSIRVYHGGRHALGGRRGDRSRALRAHIFNPKNGEGKQTGCGVGLTPQWHTSPSKATPLILPQIVSPTENRFFRYLREIFSFRVLYSSQKQIKDNTKNRTSKWMKKPPITPAVQFLNRHRQKKIVNKCWWWYNKAFGVILTPFC